MSSPQGLSKIEKRLALGAILLLITPIALIFWGDEYVWNSDLFSSQPHVGKIVTQQNDTRRRTQENFVWYKAHNNQSIHLGDSVFSGEGSEMDVTLDSGGELHLAENSMVSFNEIQNQKLANIDHGTFRIRVNGAVKIALRGEIVQLTGQNSEMQIDLLKDQKPKFKMLRGETELKYNNKPIQKLETASRLPEPILPTQPKTPDIAELFPAQNLNYTWHLYDLYDKNDFQLFEKPELPTRVTKAQNLAWNAKRSNARVQFDSSEEFLSGEIFSSQGTSVTLSSVYLGENFWRVSVDDENWSATQKFLVQAHFLENAAPKIVAHKRSLTIQKDDITAQVQLSAPFETSGFVAQSSMSPSFQSDATHTFWSPSSLIPVTFYRSGTYYYRFKSVNKNQELSTWSETIHFDVSKPAEPEAPLLAEEYPAPPPPEKSLVAQEQKPAPVKKEAAEKKNEVVAKKEEAPKAETPPPATEERKPASVANSNTAKLDSQEGLPINEMYKNTQISAEGFLWRLQSNQQYYESQEAPISTGIGVHGFLWLKHTGLEGSFRSAMLGFNKSGSRTALRDLEARYHVRFFTPFPFGLTREMQVSLFAGYEVFRNSGGELFSSHYNLMKFGTAVEYPWAIHWSMGGEFVYGYGIDGSSKKEISGNINYFFKRNLSLGAGYRVNFFDAGSLSAAPQGLLPYREGYTDLFSKMNYHF